MISVLFRPTVMAGRGKDASLVERQELVRQRQLELERHQEAMGQLDDKIKAVDEDLAKKREFDQKLKALQEDQSRGPGVTMPLVEEVAQLSINAKK